MNICFSTLGCVDYSLEQILGLAERFGIGGIEIRGIGSQMNNALIEVLSVEYTARTESLLAAAGVRPVVLGTSCAFHSTEKYAQAMREGRESIDIATRLKVPYIRVFGNRITGERNECITRVGQGICELCRYAADKNVTVLLEVHGDFNTVENLVPVLNILNGHPNFGLIWDIAHTHRVYGRRWREFYDVMKPYIRHVHVKDLSDGDGGLTLPGKGDIPIIPIMKKMLDDGYGGFFSLEWEKKWHPELDGIEVALAHFMHIVQNI
ncbi:MAG: sugar phosphate isomerase/epimerase [Clostridia bacterium]|nr:sugar phosphate isomerase/epimerase [Clostridia bacterium]